MRPVRVDQHACSHAACNRDRLLPRYTLQSLIQQLTCSMWLGRNMFLLQAACLQVC